jgi:hypothetical protein
MLCADRVYGCHRCAAAGNGDIVPSRTFELIYGVLDRPPTSQAGYIPISHSVARAALSNALEIQLGGCGT